MGPRHSKRSLDMAGTPTKSEIEGVGNAGKLEKIVDGIVEKVATNGHVDGELQNGAEPVQNGLEPVQNGEAAAVVYENSIEKIKDLKIDEKEREEVVNGVNGEAEEKVNGETDEKVDTEAKDDKKDKKKDKKEKVVKKKFSFRSFSFSKKDKSKPKEEKASDAQPKPGIEESPEALVENGEPNIDEESKESVPEPVTMDEPEEQADEAKENSTISPPAAAVVNTTVSEVVIVETAAANPADKIQSADDLPPPLPASPPPTEAKEDMITQEEQEVKGEEVKKSESMPVIDKKSEETINEVLTASEQIEEKAMDLLKVVEEKVEECKRNESEGGEEGGKPDMNDEVASADVIQVNDDISATVADEAASQPEESVNNMSSAVALPQSAEETSDKQDEFGAGESLAEMDVGSEVAPNTNEVVVME